MGIGTSPKLLFYCDSIQVRRDWYRLLCATVILQDTWCMHCIQWYLRTCLCCRVEWFTVFLKFCHHQWEVAKFTLICSIVPRDWALGDPWGLPLLWRYYLKWFSVHMPSTENLTFIKTGQTFGLRSHHTWPLRSFYKRTASFTPKRIPSHCPRKCVQAIYFIITWPQNVSAWVAA